MKHQIVKAAFLLSLLSSSVSATSWAEGEELARLIKHLEAAQSIITKAKFESDKSKRVQFDYAQLTKDIGLIKKGIQSHLHKPLEPRSFEAIKNNFSKLERSGY